MQRVELPGTDGELFSCLHWPPSERGKALTPLLYHHATGFNAQTYRVLIEQIRNALDGPEVWALDARGHGQTGAVADLQTFRSWRPYIDDLQAILSHLNRPVVLAGHSKGGTVSLSQGIHHFRLISGILAIDPVMHNPFGLWRLLVRWRMLQHPMVSAARRRRRNFPDTAAALQNFRGRGAFATWPQDSILDYVQGGTKTTASGIVLTCDPDWEAQSYVNGVRNSHVWRGIAASTYPIRIMVAGHRSTVHPKLRARLRRRPNLTLTEYPENTHFLPMESPEAVAAELLALYRHIDSTRD